MSCIYGPHQFGTEDQGWVAHFLIRALDGEPITSTATACRCATSCSSTTWSTRSCARRRNMRRIAGQAFNIGGGPANTISLLELLDLIETLHGERARGASSTPGGRPTSATTSRTRAASARRPAGRRRRRCRRASTRLVPLAAGRAAVARPCSSPRARRRHEDRAGQPALDLRGQHLLRLPRAAPAARVRLRAGAARGATGTRCCCSTGSSMGWTLAGDERRAGATSRPDVTVVTTAPSYLFWRCAPPELRVPQETIEALREHAGRASSPSARTPRRRRRRRSASSASTSRSWASAKRCCAQLAPHAARGLAASCRTWPGATPTAACSLQGGIAQCDMAALPALRWADATRPASRAPPSSLRRGAGRAGRRDGGLARLPVSLHVLREGELPERVPQAAARRDPRRARRAHRAGRRVRLLHRRDLPAEQGAAGGAGAAAGDVRRADAHRPLEPRPARPARARPAASRSRPASRASPRKAATCWTSRAD